MLFGFTYFAAIPFENRVIIRKSDPFLDGGERGAIFVSLDGSE